MTGLDEFKDAEAQLETLVEPHHIYAIRVDGRSFKKYTKDLKRPFDLKFMTAMDDAAVHLVKEVSGALFAYVQSDEITVFFSDLSNANSQLWFGGRLNKWISTTASLASVSLSRSFPDNMPATFDARAFMLKDMDAVRRYITWRRKDAFKNAITMAANCYHPHNFLMAQNTNARIALLEGTPHSIDLLPRGFRYGRLIMRHKTRSSVVMPAKDERPQERIMVDRYSWLTVTATEGVMSLMYSALESSLNGAEESLF
jgi:tRNA(His) 5'-end guanylyltransferase